MKKTVLSALAICLTAGAVTTTMTPSASAATATVTKQVQKGTTLNVRTGPGTSYAVAGRLSGGTTVTGTVSGSWLKITSGAYAGKYVSTAYLVTPTAPLKTFDDATVVAKAGQKVSATSWPTPAPTGPRSTSARRRR